MTPIGEVRFVDVTVRPVFEDERGQFVIDEDEAVYGMWIWVDEPFIVSSANGNKGTL